MCDSCMQLLVVEIDCRVRVGGQGGRGKKEGGMGASNVNGNAYAELPGGGTGHKSTLRQISQGLHKVQADLRAVELGCDWRFAAPQHP